MSTKTVAVILQQEEHGNMQVAAWERHSMPLAHVIRGLARLWHDGRLPVATADLKTVQPERTGRRRLQP